MARPRSEDKRDAIITAATRVIAAQGLSAATATIAREAGVSNGSLFTYFETKADLLNQLYVELKGEMGAASLKGLPAGDDIQAQMFHMWQHWLRWATTAPEKRRTLAHLGVSDEITAESRRIASLAMTEVRLMLERSREHGPMRHAPLAFVVSLMNGLAEATIDFMIHDPAHAYQHCQEGFDACWRVIA